MHPMRKGQHGDNAARRTHTSFWGKVTVGKRQNLQPVAIGHMVRYSTCMAQPNELLDQAKALPSEERTRIALELLDTVEPPDPLGHLNDDAWVEEIRGRAERAISGQSKGVPWADVKAKAEQKLIG